MQNWTLIWIIGNIRNLPLKITETATAARKLNRLFGEYEIEVSRDCERSFEPALVAKRHNIIEGLENIIISFYAEGMSVSDIEKQICKMYDFEVSTSTISRITDIIASEVMSWQNRPLEDLYLIVWMDGIVFKVRENSNIINKTVYLAVGLNHDGRKEVLGIWLGKKIKAPPFGWLSSLI